MSGGRKIKVLVVDDSAFVRQMFARVLNDDPEIEVVGAAMNPIIARDMIKRLDPDVITLDIEMPKMDGLSFLEKIMTLRPMPVVMVSSLTQKGAHETIRALELGAVDCIGKPMNSLGVSIDDMRDELLEKVKAAARAKVRALNPLKVGSADHVISSAGKKFKEKIIAIGASTGGVEALREIITRLPKDTPPVFVTQHMPPGFTHSFAERMDKMSEMTVQEAQDGMEVKNGNVYIAPGDRHLRLSLARIGHGFICRLGADNEEKVSGHRPSVDVMFDSIAESSAGNRAIAAILTGMGKDGAKGMLALKKSGAYTIGQDEQSSVVYGMPKAAYLAGAVDVQLPLAKVAQAIVEQCSA
ncbi:MAG: chemotaxis response regulator protein-glutamate methylesterase [Hyphomicrobiales bacterium]|nr:chemotaxis response regulator protein-glutamate methylesterase [Hyphomicrobiales bacterium]